MSKYSEWLAKQTPERQIASLDTLALCRLLGEARLKDPQSKDCKTLTQLINNYYMEWPEC